MEDGGNGRMDKRRGVGKKENRCSSEGKMSLVMV